MADFARSWLPSEWLDEAIPTPQETPDAFIRALDGGKFLLLPVGEDDGDDFYRTEIVEGQIVAFSACDDYGQIRVVVAEDRSFTILDPVPEGATQFWVPGDPDTMAYSVEEVINNGRDPLEPGEHTLGAYSWEHNAHFRFEVPHDGAPRLALCAGVN